MSGAVLTVTALQYVIVSLVASQLSTLTHCCNSSLELLVSSDMKESFLILLAVSSILCQDDPCSPNLCGPNTRCMSVNIRKQPVISCECLIGYKYPVGGSQDDGCVEVGMFSL